MAYDSGDTVNSLLVFEQCTQEIKEDIILFGGQMVSSFTSLMVIYIFNSSTCMTLHSTQCTSYMGCLCWRLQK